MNIIRLASAGFLVSMLFGSFLAVAQQPPAAPGGRGAQAPPQPMSFFVTSVGKGEGANLGGLAGADAHCQALAAAAGRGSATWHAYLSTQGPDAVNARERIGNGPWYNARGQREIGRASCRERVWMWARPGSGHRRCRVS